MSDLPESTIDEGLFKAQEDRDGAAVRAWLHAREFILISVLSAEEADTEEGFGALTVELDDQAALVAFTSQAFAGEFVDQMSEDFADDEEVQGYIMDGESLIESLPESYGLILNPETDNACILDVGLLYE
ncbi:MAG: SseB family protein [Planctomycetota bacterium]